MRRNYLRKIRCERLRRKRRRLAIQNHRLMEKRRSRTVKNRRGMRMLPKAKRWKKRRRRPRRKKQSKVKRR